MAISQGVFDLKIAQLNQETITSFKDHKRETPVIHPRNEKDTYIAGDVITFDLKGQGVDYVNMNNSILYFNVTCPNYGDETTRTWNHLLYGSMGLIARFQITSGSVDIMDINSNYGKFVYLELMGNVESENYKSWFNGIDGLFSSGSILFNDDLNLKQYYRPSDLPVNAQGDPVSRRFKVPLITILDAGGYIPVYNLAEQLQIKITLEKARDCIWGADTEAGLKYEVKSPTMQLDGLTVLGGGKMNDQPYRFHTVNAISYKNQITKSNENISYDIKKTSLKKHLGFFYNEQQSLEMDYRVRRCFFGGQTVSNFAGTNSTVSSDLCNTFVFNLGGVNFPYEQPLQGHDQYIQVEKYFHKYDLTNGLNDNWMFEIYSGWDYSKSIFEPYETAVASGLTQMSQIPFVNTVLCAGFDRLEQTGEIISGIDSERFDIQLRLTSLTRATTPGTFKYYEPFLPATEVTVTFDGDLSYCCLFWYDCIVTFAGGQVNIKD
jgi:hypothetical protein